MEISQNGLPRPRELLGGIPYVGCRHTTDDDNEHN